mmetsp:Transcript_37443/g.50670  ORF Transcript_37443/g.50670 Transcript_37443/m.50670 type:complete len:291 (-) Transcript_37443:571-1443(-)
MPVGVFHSVACAGSAAVIGVTFIHPVDITKTRLQVSGTKGYRDYKSLGLVGTVRTIGTEEGVAAFWKGIPAAWLREASYTSLRLGLYAPIKAAIGADKPDSGFLIKFSAGCLAGGLGSIVGNPFDVLKTKMMAAEGEGVGFLSTARSITASQGIGGFYKGMDANLMRAMVNNGTKMACYDVFKKKIKGSGIEILREGLPLQFMSAFSAGFVMTCAVAPFDMIRTRLMNQPVDGPRMYANFLDCGVKVVRTQGPLALWSGFLPMWGRTAPTATIQLVLYEQIMRLTGGASL